MRLKFSSVKVLAEHRKQREAGRERCEAIGAKPGDPDFAEKFKVYATPARQSARPTKRQSGRPLPMLEAESALAELFSALVAELPSLCTPGSHLRQMAVDGKYAIDPDRARAYGQRFLAGHRFELVRTN
jgi:hypothetical protein